MKLERKETLDKKDVSYQKQIENLNEYVGNLEKIISKARNSYFFIID